MSALPSENEAFGLVLAEAMACGTPGVGSNLGGIPEVLDRPEIGRLFDGDDDATWRARCWRRFELAQDPATPDACRSRALELSTETCASAYDALYRELLGRRADDATRRRVGVPRPARRRRLAVPPRA